MYKQMLVPLDGSSLAEAVFAYAKELAGRLGINLIFLNLHSPAPPISELTPMKLEIDKIGINGQSEGQSFEQADETFSVRFTCRQKPEHKWRLVLLDHYQSGFIGGTAFSIEKDKKCTLIFFASWRLRGEHPRA